MIEEKECPLCGSKELKKKLDCKDYSNTQETFTIDSCRHCDFTFTNPRPLDKNLDKYYKSENYISHTNSNTGFFNFIYQNIRKHTTEKKCKLIKMLISKGSLLDVGCGTGEFLHTCKNAGYNVVGIEPAKIARDQAIDNYKLNVSAKTDLNQFDKNEFDIITMWHVLEHVTDINSYLEKIHKILKHKGKIVVAVPNHKSWDAKYFGSYWAAWDVPIHVSHFTENTIKRFFKKFGYSHYKTKPMYYDSFYVSLLSNEYLNGRKNYIKSFLLGLASNVYAFFSKNGYSSQIYIFEKEKKD